MIPEADLTVASLAQHIQRAISHPDKLREMRNAAAVTDNSTEKLADLIESTGKFIYALRMIRR